MAGEPLTWVTDRLAVGSAPMSEAQLANLRDQGIDAILNLCGEFCDLHEIEAAHGFEVHYLPIADEEAPDLTALEKALSWLDEALYLGRKVLIHCRHGIGRTGTVLNAYLLRRGLGRKGAGKKLKGLRSKPANFEQWWTVVKYGRKAGRLTVREPSLEFRNLVDLGPFFADFEALLAEADARLKLTGSETLCGRDHARCCSETPVLSLVEAVYLGIKVNQELASDVRLAAIERALAGCRSKDENCLPCPLLVDGKCLLWQWRPLGCRTSDLTPTDRESLWQEVLDPGTAALSDQVFFAFASTFSQGWPLVFGLSEVVSGRYVQGFFNALKHGGLDKTPKN